MPIYTKKGDKGETSLISPNKETKRRVTKGSAIVFTLGSIDELNSYLGVVIAKSTDPALNEFLLNIQTNLFQTNSIIAGAKLSFASSKTKNLEKKIDELDQVLPKLTTFIHPGGVETGAHLQYARSLCRRAERNLVRLSKHQKLPAETLKYLNRLSDCLFTLARYENYKQNLKDLPWKTS